MPRCSRCGDPFELRRAGDTRCLRCATEVAAIVASDKARRAPRFPTSKSLDPWAPA